MPRILSTSRSFGTSHRPLLQGLAQAGHEVIRGPATHNLDELADISTTSPQGEPRDDS